VYLYESAYHIVQPHSVLIVGGGTGNEAAAAVRNGVEQIDVVEIDPTIIAIGREFHPERPYLNSRVRIINDDARHYMATTSQRYDLIIVGFLDSTSQLSSMSNIRLDNYVYTIESFRQARALLNPDGVLQVTYYALAGFVRLRIFSMLQSAFDGPPLMTQVRDGLGGDVVYFAGPAVARRPEFVIPGFKLADDAGQYFKLARSAIPITDDWPYLNVLERSVGGDYLLGLGAMILISYLFIQYFVWPSGVSKSGLSAGSWCFFLQGAGFMLLETSTITRMALILGSTWIVISFAIALVLLAALVSNFVVERFAMPSIGAVVALLAAAILLNYVVDIHYYLSFPWLLRTVLASLQVYLPMLASSLLFGRLFQRSEKTSFDFGMNILGALFGGMLEYTALVIGVRAVYLLALIVFLAVVPLNQRVERRA
jgi:hypothetical protein